MGFYYLTEKRKFDAEWEKLRAEYEAAGMDKESIEKMKAFDWGWFCSRRVYENHTQSLPDPEGYDDEEKSVLFRKFAALLSHDLPKTEGEPCGAREKRRCGVMTARQGDR